MNPVKITARRNGISGPSQAPDRRPGARRLRLLGPVVVASLLSVTGMTLAGQTAHAVACNDSWIGGFGTLWTTSANWSTGLPDASKDVCIGDVTAGTYAVTLDATGTAHSITVGGASGTQTLIVGNTFGSLTLSSPSSVGVNGVLNLDLSYNNANSVLAGSTVTNAGTLRVTGIPSAGGPYLRSNVINNGTLSFQAVETIIDSGVTITNNATTTVAANAVVTVRDGATFVNQTGTLTNNGTFRVRTFNSAGGFTQGSGSVTGNDPVIDGAKWNGVGAGAGKFAVLGASTLTGGITATQTLRIDNTSGNGVVGIPATFTNAGTLVLDMNYNNANTSLQPTTGTATLTNTGTLRVMGIPVSSGTRSIRVNVVNNGTLDFQAVDTLIDSGVTITNNATVVVAANAAVTVRDGATFVNQAGTLTNNGAFNVRIFNTQGTFTQGGGAVTGNDPVIDGAKWNGVGAGAGKFTVLGASTLTGAIAAAQTVRLDDTSGSGVVGIPATFTNAGTLIVDMNYNNGNTILQPSSSTSTLTNTGTLRVSGIQFSAGKRSIRVDVVNSGTFVIDSTVVLDFTGAFSQPSGGTTEFDLASATVFGQMVARSPGSVTLGGTAKPVLVGGYSPPANTTFDVITAPHTGDFASVLSSFASDVTNPSLVRLVSGVSTGGGGAGGGGGGGGAGAAVDALVPARLLDTRADGTTVDGAGQAAGLQEAGSTIEVQVIGRAGVPAGAAAAVLNVTVTDARAAGFVTVWPCGSDRPNASSLNYVAGSTVPNGVIAKIGANGKVCLYVSNAAHLLVDVAGFFSATAPYVPLVPARVLDTRPDGTTFDGQGQAAGLPAQGSVTEVQITGRAGVPADAAAVVLNVTVTEARGAGFVTVFPCGTDRPNASNLNYVTGSTVPNNVIAKIGAGGKVCLYTSNATHLLADVNGYFRPTTAFQAIVPARLLDTRADGSTIDGANQGAGVAAQGSVTEVQVTGRAGAPSGATAVVLNVTVTDAQGAGFVTVWPCGTDRPNASSLNFVQNSTVPNGVLAKLGANGKVCLYVSNGTHLLTDVAGFFTS
ncbi:MAG: hypothetical protein JWL72_2501 [Ilumatobacteraceae bacterium]|nr:hypothetical protein [Ilumatobacteraceae bacterium]